jgi:peptide methionine sulfoxide reductase MsrA
MQPAFDETPGVIETYVGYAGGDARTANYDKVSM